MGMVGNMALAQRKVLLLAADDFEDMELLYPLYRLAEEGVSVEVIDLRTLIPFDRETVLASVRRTGKVLIAHEDNLTGGFGAEVAALVAQQAFEHLDAPVTRVAGLDTPIPFTPVLEREYLPTEEDILAAARDLAAY